MGPVFFNHGSRSQRDVAILLREHLDYCLHKMEHDMDGRIIIVLILPLRPCTYV